MRLEVNGKDISNMYDNVTWSGGDGQAGRKLEFGVVVSGTDKNLPVAQIMMNDEVRFSDDEGNLIYIGEVLDKEKSLADNIMTVTSLDPLYHANNTEKSYSFEQKTPDQIASEVFGDLGIPTGTLESGEPINRVFDIEIAYNVVLTAYRLEYEKSEKPFIIRMNGENVEVVERGKQVARYKLDPKLNLYDATYGESAQNSVGSVRIFDEDGEEIGQVTNDSSGGEKIYRKEKDEDANARAKEILKGIERNASITVKGDFDLITGNAVTIEEPFTGLIGLFYIVEDTHTFENNIHTAELTLSYENVMEEIDTSVASESNYGEGSASSSSLVNASDKYLGVPYVWGGNSRSGTDCSGFVQFVYQDVGINFAPGERLTSAKMNSKYKQYGFKQIPVNEAKPGDVMWNKGHVGMMYDGNNVIEASQSRGKTVIQTAWNRNKPFTKAFRYVG